MTEAEIIKFVIQKIEHFVQVHLELHSPDGNLIESDELLAFLNNEFKGGIK